MQVAQLWRFPVKSLGGERLERVDVDALGVAGDRRWGVEDATTGKVLTARRVPRLLFAQARLVGSDQVSVELEDRTLLDDGALSEWLERPVRLVRAEPGRRGTYETVVDFEREADSDWVSWDGPEGTFHDSTRTQLSLLSWDSIGRWDVRRFRANVVLDVGPEADLVGKSLRIGTVEARVVKEIDRCVVTTRAQPGVEPDLDVLRTINREKGANLGVGALVSRPGSIAVGDRLTVLDP